MVAKKLKLFGLLKRILTITTLINLKNNLPLVKSWACEGHHCSCWKLWRLVWKEHLCLNWWALEWSRKSWRWIARLNHSSVLNLTSNLISTLFKLHFFVVLATLSFVCNLSDSFTFYLLGILSDLIIKILHILVSNLILINRLRLLNYRLLNFFLDLLTSLILFGLFCV